MARAGLIASIMEELEDLYEVFLEDGRSVRTLKEEYNQKLCRLAVMKIRVLEPGHEYTGMTEGINEHGELSGESKTRPVRTVMRLRGRSVCAWIVWICMMNRGDMNVSGSELCCAEPVHMRQKYYLNEDFKSLPSAGSG